MLEPIFGNGTAEKVLLYLFTHREAYARELALAFSLPISMFQKQLFRLERGGVLTSTTKGRTRLFRLNPVYPFARELEALLRRAMDFVPAADRRPFEPRRTRPRLTGKPA